MTTPLEGLDLATPGAAPARSPWMLAQAPLGAWWMVAVLLLFNILAMMDRMVLSLLVDPIKADLGLSDFQLSLIIGPAFAISFALFSFPMGWATDRAPRRWVVFVGVAGWSLATMAGAFARSVFGLAAARSMIGVGEAALTPAAYSLVADKFPRVRMTTALSIFAMGPKAGQAVAYTLGGLAIAFANHVDLTGVFLLEQMKPWQLVLFMFGGSGLLVSFLCFTFSEPPRTRHVIESQAAGAGQTAIGFVMGNKLLVLPLLAGFTLIGTVNSAVISWLPTYMGRAFHWTPEQFGPALGVVSLIAAGSLFVNGLAVDALYKGGMKDAHVRFYSWLVGLLIPILVVGFLVTSPWVFLVLYCLMQAMAFTYVLYMSATIQLITPGQLRGRVSGLFAFCMVIVSTGLAPTLVAAVTDFVFRDPSKLGWSIALVSVTACVFAFAALRLSLLRVKPAILALEALESVSKPGG